MLPGTLSASRFRSVPAFRAAVKAYFGRLGFALARLDLGNGPSGGVGVRPERLSRTPPIQGMGPLRGSGYSSIRLRLPRHDKLSLESRAEIACTAAER
jgi:hypothetical protein